MNCAKCEGQLAPIQIGGIEVDRCESCHGVWFDPHEMSVLLHLDAESLQPISGSADQGYDVKGGRCPRDGAELARTRSGRDRRTMIDMCLECGGIWLDAGEFDALRGTMGAQ